MLRSNVAGGTSPRLRNAFCTDDTANRHITLTRARLDIYVSEQLGELLAPPSAERPNIQTIPDTLHSARSYLDAAHDQAKFNA